MKSISYLLNVYVIAISLYIIACQDSEPPTSSHAHTSSYSDTEARNEEDNESHEDHDILLIPNGLPQPKVPTDNPLSRAKVELGRFLFYDTKLSGNQTYSCATCHQQQLAFTDGLPVAKGSTDELHTLGSMSLVNVAYNATLGWGNPLLVTLEEQALVPMFGEEPVELGFTSPNEEWLNRFRNDSDYPQRFTEAFPEDEDPISVGNIAKAIASFERTLISFNSPYDRYQNGDEDALTNAQKRGMDLFFSESIECFHCHGGFNFTDSIASADFPFSETPFHNNGMYNVGGEGRYPQNQGVFEVTRRDKDLGTFKAPSLRNIAVTAPYLHDGSVATLEEMIDLYASGGRHILDGDQAGDGREHPNKSAFVAGFELSPAERDDLVAFLQALTDESFLTNPTLSNPFMIDE